MLLVFPRHGHSGGAACIPSQAVARDMMELFRRLLRWLCPWGGDWGWDWTVTGTGIAKVLIGANFVIHWTRSEVDISRHVHCRPPLAQVCVPSRTATPMLTQVPISFVGPRFSGRVVGPVHPVHCVGQWCPVATESQAPWT